MQSIIELIGNISIMILSFLKEITEEEIDKNLSFLMKENWFQTYLEDDKYNDLIFNNSKVRHVIGTLISEKLVFYFYLEQSSRKVLR
ncbi:hypothetical protein PGH26_07620 [Sporosarcina jeotgali]|uniref:Uncharacterized protein n=1 Tax=Sporosarcina jeotgali TaxID=3020056 RepID=A0ABZ0KZH2_9BACL|nr:hypothetical protein [Sporosarcina sp. B2O-1]WOV85791.1 hypothetical protein PGH26_07620 [Sporosarcina sp. B2O-1]